MIDTPILFIMASSPFVLPFSVSTRLEGRRSCGGMPETRMLFP